MVLFFSCLLLASSTSYLDNEIIIAYANKVGPVDNPLRIYKFSKLPFCTIPSENRIQSPNSIIDKFIGNNLEDIGIHFRFKKNETTFSVCNVSLDSQKVSRFETAIKNNYHYQFIIDDLPVWGYVGSTDSGIPLLYTKLNFFIGFNKNNIVAVRLKNDRNSAVSLNEGSLITFKYSVTFFESDIVFEKRSENLFNKNFFRSSIHLYTLMNSALLVVLLAVLVALIINKINNVNENPSHSLIFTQDSNTSNSNSNNSNPNILTSQKSKLNSSLLGNSMKKGNRMVDGSVQNDEHLKNNSFSLLTEKESEINVDQIYSFSSRGNSHNSKNSIINHDNSSFSDNYDDQESDFKGDDQTKKRYNNETNKKKNYSENGSGNREENDLEHSDNEFTRFLKKSSRRVYVGNYGWLAVRKDVFRQPKNLSMISVLAGLGIQALISLLFYSIVNFVCPSFYTFRGKLISLAFISILFLAPISGFMVSSFGGFFGCKKWLRLSLSAPIVVFLPAFVIAVLNSTLSKVYSTIHSINFFLLFFIFMILSSLSMLLSALGGFLSYKLGLTNFSNKLRNEISLVPRKIEEDYIIKPQQHRYNTSNNNKYRRRPFCLKTTFLCLIVGLLCCCTVLIEFFYILTAIWQFKYFYLWIYIVTSITCMCFVSGLSTIIIIYIILQNEDYRWQWPAFLGPASCGLYLYIYSIYFLLVKTSIRGIFEVIYFMTNNLLLVSVISIACGGTGYLVSTIFVYKIYSNLKYD
ncbi:hypothetical protein TRFO_17169 [Tritrichomonas foetus]|uniref:Transmembrane 9 superfamily member n=1 Tax=Tritrichomonas foetus TaxID=1144522 RepID=A0A1J4KNX9_9EUKA|nr:hypothetical protein TRFO_17169 [Tritrichomonas foetus]|eukprot:OHT12818.1 hypothetical protein TRFO_17169 [Tritrichomonas foetus]